MNSYGFLQKLRGEGSSKPKKLPTDNELSSFDLFYQTSYMSATAAAEIPRQTVFALASELPCPVARYFAKVNIITQELGYDYAEACRTIGETSESSAMKSFLLRFSNSLASGEPEADFLGREAQVQATNYENEYDRDLESMRKWTDAYAALIVSVTLVIVINAVSTLIYEVPSSFMLGMTVLAVGVGLLGSWIIWRASPKEVGELTLPGGSKEQVLAHSLMRTLLPATCVICLALLVVGVDLSWIVILAALLLFPLGILGMRDDRSVVGKSKEFGFFIRTLGGMATAAGTTLTDALTRVDLRSFPALGADIESLRLRLVAGIDPGICWQRFRSESGSELINQSGSMFYDSVDMGGDPERVGFFCALYATMITDFQAKRKTVAGTFTGLSVVMHAVVVGLMILIVEIVSEFLVVLDSVGAAGTSELPLPIFSYGSTEVVRGLYQMLSPVIVVLTFSTAFALKAAEGGARNKFFFYLCILFLVVGACLLLVPVVAGSLFSGLAM